MSTQATNDEDRSGEARFKWKTVALWAVIVALVSVTALAIVATIAQADALSVVALALAVMAFVVQIIVFIVQGNAASQQAADAAALNAQTLRALATIEEKFEGTRETVGKINDRLLDFAFTKATAEAESESAGAPEPTQAQTEQVLERAKRIIKSSQDRDRSHVRHEWLQESASPLADVNETRRVLPTFVDTPLSASETAEAERVIRDLDDKALPLLSLNRLGKDLANAERAGVPQEAGMSTINDPAILHEKGLIMRTKRPWSSRPVFVLTDAGRVAAKALLVTPAPPSDAILRARRQVEDFLAQTARVSARLEKEAGTIPLSP